MIEHLNQTVSDFREKEIKKKSKARLLRDYTAWEGNTQGICSSLRGFEDGGGFGRVNIIILDIRFGRQLALLVIKISAD